MLDVKFDIDAVMKTLDGCKEKIHEFAVEFVQDLNAGVVKATPVKTGFLRGSWWAQLNSVPSGSGAADMTGGTAVARMNMAALGLQLGDTYNAANGASYAAYLEYGTSRIAPRLFVTSTMERAGEIANQAAARVADGG